MNAAAPSSAEGFVPFDGHETWYRIVGDLGDARTGGPAPLVTLHGGPGATHDYLLSVADLAEQSSHMPMWEEREAYMEAVGDFLRRND